MRALDGMTERQRKLWVEKARYEAIMGSSKGSHKSILSGLRCYVAFVSKLLCGLYRRSALLLVSARRLFSRRRESLPAEIGVAAGVVRVIQIGRHPKELSWVCQNWLHAGACEHVGGKRLRALLWVA